jgi:hypothetical protein
MSTTHKKDTESEKEAKPGQEAPAAAAPVAPEPIAMLDQPPDELEKLAAEAVADLVGFARKIGRMVHMTSPQRQHSNGKLRDGEAEVQVGLLDMMDAFPGYFMALAGKDGGKDPKVLETGPARDDLRRAAILLPLQQSLETLAEQVTDTRLRAIEHVRALTIPGYAIGLANEEHDDALQSAIAGAKQFYGDLGRKAVRARSANAAARNNEPTSK